MTSHVNGGPSGAATTADPRGIVVGVDQSPAAADAIRWALEESRLRGCPLTAVLAWTYLAQPHAQPDAPFDPGYCMATAQSTLEQFVADAAPDEHGSIVCRAVCDLPTRALLEASSDAEMLVVGARGLGGIRGLLLGSVSQQCVQHSAVPVAVVRRSGGGTSGRIVVGLDCSSGSQRALAWALEEARLRQVPVRVVHAWPPVIIDVPEGESPSWQSISMPQEARRTVSDVLEAHRLEGLDVEVEVVEGSAARAILRAADDASMIVVGSRGRGGFAGLRLGSVSHHVVTHASGTVVVVPAADAGTR